MFMIMFVLDDSTYLDQILEAWKSIQISGVTIIESTGLYRRLKKHIPLRYTFGNEQQEENGNITLFAIVKDETIIEKCLQKTELIVGDLNLPNTGVFAAWPLTIVKGVPA
jgi:hypothetical protein